MIDLHSFVARFGLAAAAAIGTFLAAVVVLCATPPRSAREWVIGLISTVMGSITGGAVVIEHFQLQSWMASSTGLMAVLGLVFACGLPAWALVRWMFTFIERRRDRDLVEVAGEIRDTVKSIRE